MLVKAQLGTFRLGLLIRPYLPKFLLAKPQAHGPDATGI
jgi:hypothetical protein